MLLQQRSKKCSYLPLGWSTSVGGHVQSGETYEEASIRETKEEIDIQAPLKLLYQDVYEDSSAICKHLETFKLIHNGPFNININEVKKVEFFTLKKICKMIKSNKLFHPELLFLLKRHYQFDIN